ncbi:MAG: type II toxin-antitoxin system Phd/YefM family antitoxin [Spirochaetales bacterium]|jgi:prevent-host-death family protein|nr:type II toxin-antitoxin system Phd/YefM family antitoxin [Spirochaetales bacterium]
MIIKENMHSAKTNFSKLVKRALAGDEVIIAKSGKPLVKLVPIGSDTEEKRFPGSAKGQFSMSLDFNEPLSESELTEWGL